MRFSETIKSLSNQLRYELSVLVIASRDPRLPWHVKALVVGTIAYAVSPIDLIPDFIPILGQLDDLIIIPLGIVMAFKLIPIEVLNDARASIERNDNKLLLIDKNSNLKENQR